MTPSSSSEVLPELPKVALEIRREERVGQGGFLRIRRLELAVVREGEASSTIPYDVLDRAALDASVMVAHHVEDGVVHVWLRSCVRPPVAMRPMDPRLDGALWELPAGLVEPGESPQAGAARELEEELGFRVEVEALRPLGEWMLPAPGFVGEIHYFFHVRVDPRARRHAGGDGSPLERGAAIVSVPLARALEACRRGEIRDAKTELALRRLADALADGRI